MNYAGKCALVTGASAGIGEAFAAALAAKGANLILTARRGDRLNRLAANLQEKFGVEAVAVEADLSKADAPEKIESAAIAAGRPVDILVNNAGYGQPGHFEQTVWSTHRDFLELMVVSYAHLVRLFLPSMQSRDYGRIINVASLAGLIPGSAGHTMYGAAKAFLVSFSQSLAAESAGSNVKVSALCPGFTYSEFHDVNETRHLVGALPKYMFMQAAPVAEGALAAVERGEVVYVPGLWNKYVAWMMKALPRSMAEAAVAAQSRKIRRAEAG